MELLKQEDKRYHIDTSRKVFVYKNLHKDCWSIKQDGLVKAHTHDLEMWDCAFYVNAKGRAKVLEEKRKNVHAGIKGYIDEHGVSAIEYPLHAVTYNPYKYDSFVDKTTEEPIYYSQFSRLSHKQVLAA
tara:strand:- start:726 stop:1112 length:387 start_codon:yes stop_codon:yes gene_type:complete